MRKSKIRIIVIPLLLSILAAAVSCAGGGSDADASVSTTAPADSVETTSEAVDEETEIKDGIGEYDFNGKVFSIVLSDDQLGPTWPYHVDELNGDLLNDAVFNRDSKVNERFNTDITYFSAGGDYDKPIAAMKSSVLAGDGAYQLCINHMYGGFNGAIADGVLYDFNKIPIIDLTKPWWNQSIRENLEVEGVLLTAVSDIVYVYVDVVYFNKEIMDNHSIEYPYEKVHDGSWTWDYLARITKDITEDLNGDGQYTEVDRYGMVIDANLSSMTRLIHSNGMTMATIGSDGRPTLEGIMSDKMQSVIDKYYSLLYDDNRSYRTKVVNEICVMFAAGQAMAMHTQTSKLTQLRDMEQEFGITPLPKYDENQDGYKTLASSQMLLLAADITDEEFVGVMLEAMSAESYCQITPVLFDVIFESKYLRDEESFDMFKLMRSSLVYDFNWNFGNGNKMAYLIGNTAGNKNTDLASYYAANVTAAQTILDKVYDDIIKNYAD
ncbi:MAG: extracellular solute-binding protein [Clostridiales bacterium]|nr:extracellular solute-binding protein [Clostridiales bacterium]